MHLLVLLVVVSLTWAEEQTGDRQHDFTSELQVKMRERRQGSCTAEMCDSLCTQVTALNNNMINLKKVIAALDRRLNTSESHVEELKRENTALWARVTGGTAIPTQPTKERDDLHCDYGWKKWRSSCYWVSPAGERKTWEESRRDCTSKGAGSHLVIVNNREEQEFIFTMVKVRGQWFWIGLSDLETEGVWKWEDGSKMNTHTLHNGYWNPGEPDGGTGSWGEADCVFIHHEADALDSWYDSECGFRRPWLCEKS